MIVLVVALPDDTFEHRVCCLRHARELVHAFFDGSWWEAFDVESGEMVGSAADGGEETASE